MPLFLDFITDMIYVLIVTFMPREPRLEIAGVNPISRCVRAGMMVYSCQSRPGVLRMRYAIAVMPQRPELSLRLAFMSITTDFAILASVPQQHLEDGRGLRSSSRFWHQL